MNDPIVVEHNISLIDSLLEDQRTLRTPVAEISDKYDEGYKEKRFKHLIPLTTPSLNNQYAFKVDLDKCTGCKSCVAACHSLNGLDEKESFRDVGKIVSNSYTPIPFQQTVTTACHHCSDPACLNGCPVNAYEKDSITGIVKHLDDQCIGCQYCVMKCPYDVPKYHAKLGIVRKCDMCQQRLTNNEAPACVQSCPNEAISIIEVSKEEIETNAQKEFLPGTPDPSYTKPATRYVGSLPEIALEPADKYKLKKEHEHAPLIAMLLLTQASLGFLVWGVVNEFLYDGVNSLFYIASLVTCVAGIGAATLHLGQPLKAWKVFLGLRTSWMSREVIVFSLFLGNLATIVTVGFLKVDIITTIAPFIKWAAIPLGVISVFCSVKLYQDTQRTLWNYKYSVTKFFGSVITLGGIGSLLLMAFSVVDLDNTLITLSMIVGILAKLWLDVTLFIREKQAEYSSEKRAALLIKDQLRGVFTARIIASVIALIALVFTILTGSSLALFAVATGAVLLSEATERYLYFVTVDAPKMPGN